MDAVAQLVPPERRREAAVLAWLVLEAGSGGLFVLCGPPGCGKSLVVEALLACAAAAAPRGPLVAARCLRPEAAPSALCAALARVAPCPAPSGACRTSRDTAAHVHAACATRAGTALRLLVVVDGGAAPLGPADDAAWAALAAWPRLLARAGAVCSVLAAARACAPDFAALHAPTVLPLAPYTRAQCVAVAARLYAPCAPGFAPPARDDPLASTRGVAAYLDLLARLFLAEHAPAVRPLLRLALQHEQLYRACVSRALAAAASASASESASDTARARAAALLDGRARFTDLCARQRIAARDHAAAALLAALPVKALHTLIACYLAAHTRAAQDGAFVREPLPGAAANGGDGTGSGVADGADGDDDSKTETRRGRARTPVRARAARLQLTTVVPNARGFPLRRALFIQRHLFGCTASCTARDGSSSSSSSSSSSTADLTPSERLALLEDDAAPHDFGGAVRELTRLALLRPLPAPTLAQQVLLADTLAQRYECTAPRTLVHEAAAALVPPLCLDEFVAPGAS